MLSMQIAKGKGVTGPKTPLGVLGPNYNTHKDPGSKPGGRWDPCSPLQERGLEDHS